MLRSSNQEGEQVSHVSQALAPEEKSSRQARQQISSRDSAIGAKATTQASYARGGLPPRVVRRLREHIDSNIDHRISVDTMAKLANLSVCYFTRAFDQSVGLTPHDYVIRRRVERTRDLLLGTDMSLSEIALAAGFSDQSHCARRFRQHFGMSPREYRWSIP
jgi:AraC-like DNA-binding protein